MKEKFIMKENDNYDLRFYKRNHNNSLDNPPDKISEEFNSIIEKIKDKCKSKNVEIIKKVDYFNFLEIYLIYENAKIQIKNIKHAKKILNSNFEKYNHLYSYKGIYSKEENKVEIQLKPQIPISGIKLFALLFNQKSESLSLKWEDEIEINLGRPSKNFSVLFSKHIDKYTLTFKIKNINIDEDNIEEMIRKITDSFLFQIDRKYNIPLKIVKKSHKNNYESMQPVKNLNFDNLVYEKEAMELYKYANSIRNKPLLQYLSYYQVVEYYFPVYSKRKLINKVENNIIDPKYNIHNKKDLYKIIDYIGRRYNNYTKEQQQLKFVINEILDKEEVEEFIKKDKQKKEHFKKDKVSNVKIDIEDDNLLDNISNRIYKLRCKIVHKKENQEYLTPYSKKIKNIYYDISLIRFVAQKALIADSRAVKIFKNTK